MDNALGLYSTIPADPEAPLFIYEAVVASLGEPKPPTPVEAMNKRQRHKLAQHQNRVMRKATT